MKTFTKFLFFYAIPIFGIPYVFYFYSRIETLDQVLFRILFPALLMWIVVGFGAGYLRMWGFFQTFQIRQVIPQIGLIYSAITNLLACFYFGLMETNPVHYVFMTTVVGGIAGCLYDFPILKYGFLRVRTQELNRQASTFKILLSYGPRFFSMVGFVIGSGMLFGNLLLQKGLPSFVVITTTTVLGVIPFFGFFYAITKWKPLKPIREVSMN